MKTNYKHDDKAYWEEYYERNKHPTEPSDFAKFVAKHLKRGSDLCEIGCGNARDSMYFRNVDDHNTVAIDQCEGEVDFLNNTFGDDRLKFKTHDIKGLPSRYGPFDGVYMRFVLHAITEEEEDLVLKWIYDNLKVQGVFYSESRSVKEELFGKGTCVGKNSYFTDHYRRFMDSDLFTKKLLKAGFTMDYMVESKGLAMYKDEDPVIVRIFARKT